MTMFAATPVPNTARARPRRRSPRGRRSAPRSARRGGPRRGRPGVGDHGAGRCARPDTIAVVRSGEAGEVRRRDGPSRSNTRNVSASPSPSRCGARSAGPMRRCDTTGPPFWPCRSGRPLDTSPSRFAAVESTWPTVATPVPPMPANKRAARSGMPDRAAARGSRRARRRLGPGVTVTNAGQSPSMQLMSRLHESWWMRVLRPNGVSTGCTLRQFETSPQWPQPSHTPSLMITRSVGPRPRRACVRGAVRRRTPGRRSAPSRPPSQQLALGLVDAGPAHP